MRPVTEQCLPLAELYMTRIDLGAVALLNDALDVKFENERRAAERAGD